jgi:hypothetical protein
MIAFNFDKQKAWEILVYFKKYYDLDENVCKELDKNFAEYSKLYESNLAIITPEPYDHQELDKSRLTTLQKYESFLTHNESANESNIDENENKNNLIINSNFDKKDSYYSNRGNQNSENMDVTEKENKNDKEMDNEDKADNYEKNQIAIKLENNEDQDPNHKKASEEINQENTKYI